MTKSIIVTGGAGFLGSHLCKSLVESGDNVLCVDNFCTGRRENVHFLLDNERFTLLQHDIVYPLYVEADEIYNLACPASPIRYQYDPIQTTKTNVIGAINMLGLAKRTGAKVLQASTSEVYGDPSVHPQPESYWGHVNAVGPRSCYDEGKRCAETLFVDYYHQHKTRIKISRIFNTFGPNMEIEDGRVISNFIVQAIKGLPITIYGNGTQTRSFCYCDDLIRGLRCTMGSPEDFTGPVNLGTSTEVTILQLAKIILELTGSRSCIEFKALPTDDPKQRRPDTKLAQEKLGWKPDIELREGLMRTIIYFEQTLRKCRVLPLIGA